MLAQLLTSVVAFAAHGLAAPAPDHALVARQGYSDNCTSTYQIRLGDNCNRIRDYFGDVFTLQEFYSWNPRVNSYCSNLSQGQVVCVGINNSTGVAPACPTPVKAGLAADCAKCYQVVEGDYCQGLFDTNNITLAQFRGWNSDINSGCSNLEVGYNYCVGVDTTTDAK